MPRRKVHTVEELFYDSSDSLLDTSISAGCTKNNSGRAASSRSAHQNSTFVNSVYYTSLQITAAGCDCVHELSVFTAVKCVLLCALDDFIGNATITERVSEKCVIPMSVMHMRDAHNSH